MPCEQVQRRLHVAGLGRAASRQGGVGTRRRLAVPLCCCARRLCARVSAVWGLRVRARLLRARPASQAAYLMPLELPPLSEYRSTRRSSIHTPYLAISQVARAGKCHADVRAPCSALRWVCLMCGKKRKGSARRGGRSKSERHWMSNRPELTHASFRALSTFLLPFSAAQFSSI